jgi:hypothetical protein
MSLGSGFTDWPVRACTSSAECPVNNLAGQALGGVTVNQVCASDPVHGSLCRPLTLAYQCMPWGLADGPPPERALLSNEASAADAASHHCLYPPRTVKIDLRPGCPTKFVAPGARGLLPVAILPEKGFDPADVDPASLHLLGSNAVDAVMVEGKGEQRRLVARFAMPRLGRAPKQAREAVLTGWLRDSQAFTGVDRMTVVPSAEPELTLRADRTGYNVTIRGRLDGKMERHTLADCVSRAVDRCGRTLQPNTAGHVLRITSDEKEAGPPPMEILGPSAFAVRRERSAEGDGRVYTVVFTVDDTAGEATTATCRIEVPRDPKRPAVDSGAKLCAGKGCANPIER